MENSYSQSAMCGFHLEIALGLIAGKPVESQIIALDIMAK